MEFNGFDPKTKIWSGPELTHIYHPDISIGDLLLTIFRRDPKKVVQICNSTGRKFTCEEIIKLSIAVAENLILKGFKQDTDIIGIISENIHFLLPVVYGAFIAGIPITTLDPLIKIGDITKMFGQTRPSIIFADEIGYENMKQAAKNINLNSPIYILNTNNGEEKNLQEFLELNKPDTFYSSYKCPKLINGSDQTAAILFSSGTTGPSKGACLSHKMLIRSTVNFRYITREDVLLAYSKLNWLTGVCFLMISTTTACCRIITDKTFSSSSTLGMIQKHKISEMFMTTAQTASIAYDTDIKKYDLSSVKMILTGGSICPGQVIEKMQSHLKHGFVKNAYGLTETGTLGTFTSYCATKLSTSGKVGPGVEIKIIDYDTNEPLDSNQEGEICIRMGLSWSGYYNNEEATKIIYDEHKWIHTGDLGYFDKDGYLFIIGRKKEIFKYKNCQIHPTELEMIIAEIPGVQNVAVVPLFNEREATDNVAAAIVKKKDSNLTAREVEDYVNAKVSDYKRLRGGIFFLKSLPMTSTGKIIKTKVPDLLYSMKPAEL